MFASKIFISPRYTPENYFELGLNINSISEDWEKAIDIFLDRMNGRFFNAIDILLEKSKNFPVDCIDFSFSSMALMCLMIETLHQFYNGLDETVWRRHGDAFIEFLTMSENFNFTNIEARLFYRHIRNGIIHQAQTKRNSQLTISSEKMVEILPDGIRVDVFLFYEALRAEVLGYVVRLRNPDKQIMRRNFIYKMNYILRDIRS